MRLQHNYTLMDVFFSYFPFKIKETTTKTAVPVSTSISISYLCCCTVCIGRISIYSQGNIRGTFWFLAIFLFDVSRHEYNRFVMVSTDLLRNKIHGRLGHWIYFKHCFTGCKYSIHSRCVLISILYCLVGILTLLVKVIMIIDPVESIDFNYPDCIMFWICHISMGSINQFAHIFLMIKFNRWFYSVH